MAKGKASMKFEFSSLNYDDSLSISSVRGENTDGFFSLLNMYRSGTCVHNFISHAPLQYKPLLQDRRARRAKERKKGLAFFQSHSGGIVKVECGGGGWCKRSRKEVNVNIT